MTLLYRVMVVSWLSVLVVAAQPVLRFSYKQARALIWSGSHEHVFLGTALCLGFRVGAVAIRVTSPEDLQLVSTRRVLHHLLRICKTCDVVVDIWVSMPTTVAIDDLTVLRTPREEWKLLEPFRAA